MKYRQVMLEHLIWMASMDGAKAYAWGRALELDKIPYFKGIPEDLIKAMKAKNERNA